MVRTDLGWLRRCVHLRTRAETGGVFIGLNATLAFNKLIVRIVPVLISVLLVETGRGSGVVIGLCKTSLYSIVCIVLVLKNVFHTVSVAILVQCSQRASRPPRLRKS